MAIMLPQPVDDFLSFIGINFPNVNEDKVREFGDHVQQFANDLQNTHQGATGTVQELGSAYQGDSYQQLFATWGRMSSEHMDELLTGCHVVSDAMHIGADVIVGMKVEAIAQLVVMAIEFLEAQAAAIETLGASEAVAALIEEAAQQLVKFLEQELTGYVEGKIIDAAVGPLVEKVESAVEGMVYKGVADGLGVSAKGSGPSVTIAPSQVIGYAQSFRQHADSFDASATSFTSAASSVSFE
jgi:hypothetical protein